jgi:hypothetical protein
MPHHHASIIPRSSLAAGAGWLGGCVAAGGVLVQLLLLLLLCYSVTVTVTVTTLFVDFILLHIFIYYSYKFHTAGGETVSWLVSESIKRCQDWNQLFLDLDIDRHIYI